MAARNCSYRVLLAVLASLVLAGTAEAQRYVTDAVCSICHTSYHESYQNSGHPHKLTHTGGLVPEPGTWPFTPNPWLPASLDWGDVEFVIGNFFWKARFVDRQGYIYTGNDAQFNLATAEQVPYHPENAPGTKPFDCGRCHTTGYDASAPNELEGIVGNWAEEGVRCEACHGPCFDHVNSILDTSIPVVYPPREQAFGIPVAGDSWKDCDECHYRDAEFRMPWKGGFMRHHQQGEDFSHSPHHWFPEACNTCHNPHRSAVFFLGGVKQHCTDCHSESEHEVGHGMSFLDCTDCHMPFMNKSAVAFSDYEADVRGHLFEIMTDPIAAADNVTNGFWNQEADGSAKITLDYACLKCHEDKVVELGSEAAALEWAADHAAGIHDPDHAHNPIAEIQAFVDDAIAAGDLVAIRPSGFEVLNYLLDLAYDAYEDGRSDDLFWYLVYAYAISDGNPNFLPDFVAGPATGELLLMLFDAIVETM